jgi:hypothetical protein
MYQLGGYLVWRFKSLVPVSISRNRTEIGSNFEKQFQKEIFFFLFLRTRLEIGYPMMCGTKTQTVIFYKLEKKGLEPRANQRLIDN